MPENWDERRVVTLILWNAIIDARHLVKGDWWWFYPTGGSSDKFKRSVLQREEGEMLIWVNSPIVHNFCNFLGISGDLFAKKIWHILRGEDGEAESIPHE